MDQRLEQILESLKTFAVTRPVTYGAPAFAVVGVLAGLAMRPGPQLEPYNPEMEPTRVAQQDYAEPIAWPAGKVPDYVVGTDFLEATRPPPVQMVSYEPDYAPAPAPDVPPYVSGRHGPATPPPSDDASHWASERGDILDVSLPEDRAPQPVPTVLADAAAVGMTTR
ncbi:hypothetical protein [Caulobacter segnis]|jgi:hypothetical protein|uniref:hypothetical protein n=1 Tax=Caulobacter segnis TaxID=88688 RepID=UPI001CC0351D|nr:hypothetical protein [Caulobacter segnis]UAL12180.1 hypothetical protein K8940_07845 [Caulobacter segnis]